MLGSTRWQWKWKFTECSRRLIKRIQGSWRINRNLVIVLVFYQIGTLELLVRGLKRWCIQSLFTFCIWGGDEEKKSDVLLPGGEMLSTSTVPKVHAEWQQLRSSAWKSACSCKLYWRLSEQFSKESIFRKGSLLDCWHSFSVWFGIQRKVHRTGWR